MCIVCVLIGEIMALSTIKNKTKQRQRLKIEENIFCLQNALSYSWRLIFYSAGVVVG
jgi:hypothetical protein